MMKRTVAAFLLSLLTFSSTCQAIAPSMSVSLSFASNMTTGYAWTGFVVGGTSVELDSSEGTYVENENPEKMDGVGGKTYYTLTPVESGRSVVAFSYGQQWEPDSYGQETILLVDVDENLYLSISDISDCSKILGTVAEVNQEESSVTLLTDTDEEIVALFDSDIALPVVDEAVCLYTDGAQMLSLPAQVTVLGWETIPDETAR